MRPRALHYYYLQAYIGVRHVGQGLCSCRSYEKLYEERQRQEQSPCPTYPQRIGNSSYRRA